MTSICDVINYVNIYIYDVEVTKERVPWERGFLCLQIAWEAALTARAVSGARGSSFCSERDSPARKLLRDAALTSREQSPILAESFAGSKVHLCAEIVQYPGVLTSSHKGDKNSILSYVYVFIEIKARVFFSCQSALFILS